MIPLSTAKFDPAWYHQGQGQDYQWKDKNGVWNGLRAEEFAPGPLCDSLCRGPDACRTRQPQSCQFLTMYYNQLRHLDFNNIITRMKMLSQQIQKAEHFSEEPIIILIVHETPNNPCSERNMIIRWFADNGYELKEFNKENI